MHFKVYKKVYQINAVLMTISDFLSSIYIYIYIYTHFFFFYIAPVFTFEPLPLINFLHVPDEYHSSGIAHLYGWDRHVIKSIKLQYFPLPQERATYNRIHLLMPHMVKYITWLLLTWPDLTKTERCPWLIDLHVALFLHWNKLNDMLGCKKVC